MRKLALISLAAGAALVPALAAAQPVPGYPGAHIPHRGAHVPPSGAHVPHTGAHVPPAGHSWRHPGPTPGPGWGRQPGTRPPHARPPGTRPPGWHSGHPGARPPGVPHRPRWSHIPRIPRGHFVPQFWWGPQFHIQHWQTYGLQQPRQGQRWVRYYDDAYLIDGRGMVHHGQHGLDWDQYGDHWGYDQRGVPVYVGGGDFHPDQGDYAWVESHGQQYAEGYGHGGKPQLGYGGWDYGAYGQADCACYGSGHAQAYAHGGYGGVVVTTTTTTTVTQPTVIQRTYYVEEVAERRTVKRAPKPAPRRPVQRRVVVPK